MLYLYQKKKDLGKEKTARLIYGPGVMIAAYGPAAKAPDDIRPVPVVYSRRCGPADL